MVAYDTVYIFFSNKGLLISSDNVQVHPFNIYIRPGWTADDVDNSDFDTSLVSSRLLNLKLSGV